MVRCREHRLRLRRVCRQHHFRDQIQVLHARRADAFDLAFLVELDRAAERHLAGDVGLPDRVGERLRLGALRAPEGVGSRQDRLEGETDVQAVEHQLFPRVALEEGFLDGLGERRVRVVPGHVGDRVLGEPAERLEVLLLVHPWRARADDAHRVPALLHHLAAQEDGVVQAANQQQEVGVGRFRLRQLHGQVFRRRVIGDRVDDLERQLRQARHEGADAFRHRLAEGVVDVHEDGAARHAVGRLEELADQSQAVAHDVDGGLEVAEHELVALLGDLRRACGGQRLVELTAFHAFSSQGVRYSKRPMRPYRKVSLGPRDVVVERRLDGTIHLRSPHVLSDFPTKLTERLEHWAGCAPERVFLAQRDARGGWRTLTYAEALDKARRIGECLLRKDVSIERPIAVLSGNDIEHALLELAALYIGVPYAPISPAYSLLSSDFGKLRQILRLLTPGLIYAADAAYRRAIDATLAGDIEVFSQSSFAELLRSPATRAVDAAHASVGPNTIAKFLFTSGSTGAPKAVINTQRMWCSNQEMIRTALAFFREEPPVIVDWAPWHHTAGGNHDFGLVLYNGGSLYIDEGKQMPGAIETTVKNLRESAPTWYFNVPKGYEALRPYLRSDADLSSNFFSRLKVLWFAGAGVSQPVFDEMKELACRSCGEAVPFLTGLGATETAPMVLARVWETDDAGNMGLPAPGVEIKLVPFEGKFEMRVKGSNVTPGYWRQPELTAQAFDEEGLS